MASLYHVGRSVAVPLPAPVHALVRGSQDFAIGSRWFYDRERIGAVSHTGFGTLADGIVAVILDAIHVILMIGGAFTIARLL